MGDGFRTVGLVILGDDDVGAKRDAFVLIDRARTGDGRHIHDGIDGHRDLNRVAGSQKRDFAARQRALDCANFHTDIKVNVAVDRRAHLQPRRQEVLELGSRRRWAWRERQNVTGLRHRNPVRQHAWVNERAACRNGDPGELIRFRAVSIDARNRDRQTDVLIFIARRRTRNARPVRHGCNRDDHRHSLHVGHAAQVFGRCRNGQSDVLIGIRRRQYRQRRKRSTDLCLGSACKRHRTAGRQADHNSRTTAERDVTDGRARWESRDGHVRDRLRQSIVDHERYVIAKRDPGIFICRLCRRRDLNGIGHRVDEDADRSRRNLPVAIRAFGRDRDNAHARERAALVRWRQEINIANLRRRQRIGLRAGIGNRKRIFDAETVGDLSIRINAADLHDMAFRTVGQIAERGGEVGEVNGNIFVRRLRVARRGHGVGHRFDIDMVGKVYRLTVEIAGQIRRNVALDRRNRNVQRDSAVVVGGRRHLKRQQ